LISGGLSALGTSTQALGQAGQMQAQNQLMRQVGVPSGLFGASRFLGEAAKTFAPGTQGQPANPFVFSPSYDPLQVYSGGGQAPT
jgi:hypothetical protein